MKRMFLVLGLFAFALMLTAADDRPAVTYLNHEDVTAALSKGTSLTMGQDYRVAGARRTGPGQVEVHDKEIDIIYITDGEATVVTGGKMLGGKQTRADQWLGTDIQGGETRHLVKGDILVVPAGTPHWFKDVPQSINYYLVKVVKPSEKLIVP